MPTVTELWDGRGDGSRSTGGRGNEGIQRRYRRRFRVMLDNREQGVLDVYEATGIPRLGDPFASGDRLDLTARCVELEPESTEEPREWYMTANYSSDPADFGDPLKEIPGGPANEPGQKDGKPHDPNSTQNNEDDDPVRQPAEINYDEGTYQEVAYEDDDGRACNYSNGEPIDPPLMREVRYMIMTITRNQASWDAQKMMGFGGARNSEPFFGHPAGMVKARTPKATQQFTKGGRAYFRATYVFEIRESHAIKVLDAGYFEIVANKRVPIMDKFGRPIAAPWPLDNNGGKLSEASVLAGSAFYRTFNFGEEKDFAGLNLP